MNRELFGVFGDREAFARFRPTSEFDVVLCGERVTVGIRDAGLGMPGWSARYVDDDTTCVIWGEAYAPEKAEDNAARWLARQFADAGIDALASLNGSYLAVLEHDGDAVVATDPVRSRECFYTDDPGVRVFGTDSAAVGRTVDSPTIRRDGVLEFLHLGVMLGEKTSLEQLHRLPLDSVLTPTAVEPLDRFVYEPREFDYVDEFENRLRRATRRRRQLPGSKGLLLSAGYDSRLLLSQIPGIESCYTVGAHDAQEVRGASRLAEQYDAAHTSFPPDERYLPSDASRTAYSHGIKESIHVHHAGYTDEIGVDTMYHGLLCDTFFRGHFNARGGIDVLGKRVPLNRPATDPDPVETLVDRFGYVRDASYALAAITSLDDDPDAFVERAVETEFARARERADDVQNALNCCGIANQPSMPFHTHLADNFFASFLATDVELIDWHLTTPPAHRTTETFLEACKRIDPALIRHRPPDRPYDSPLCNEVERFVRRKTPLLTPFDPPWPDRESLFARHDLDRHLLPELEHLHELSPRYKLRLVDLLGWLELVSDCPTAAAVRMLDPSAPVA